MSSYISVKSTFSSSFIPLHVPAPLNSKFQLQLRKSNFKLLTCYINEINIFLEALEGGDIEGAKEKESSLTQQMTPEQYGRALAGIGLELDKMAIVGNKGFRDPTKKIYQNSMTFVAERNDIGYSFNETDSAVMNYYQDKYFPPTFKRLTSDTTPYNYKNSIK